ncbi:AI-2E family transporter [Intrasporangium mesophilum]
MPSQPEPSTQVPPGAPVQAGGQLLPRGLVVIVGLAAGLVFVLGLHRISGLVAPAFLALVLTVAASPIRTLLVDRGAPRWLGATAAIVVVTVGLIVFVVLLVVSVARFAELIPTYAATFDDLVAQVTSWLAGLGVQAPESGAMLSSVDLNGLNAWLAGLLGGVVSALTSLVFVLALVLFTCMDASRFTASLERLRAERPAFVEAMDSFTHLTRRYLIVSSVFGFVVAVIDTLMLWALGVPAPLLWGLLAFITNYIPNIGFVIGLIPPAVLALLEGGWELCLTVIVAYSVVNLVIQSVIQPRLVGDAVGLSATVTFLSLVVWAAIIGPLGAILAVPLTLFAKALLVDVDPRTRWVGALLGDRRLE